MGIKQWRATVYSEERKETAKRVSKHTGKKFGMEEELEAGSQNNYCYMWSTAGQNEEQKILSNYFLED